MNLYIRQRFFSLGDKYDVTDEADRPVFRVAGKVFSFGAKITIYDMMENELFYIEQKIFRFLPEYEIYKNGVFCARVKKEFSFFRPRLLVTGEGGAYEIEGNFFALDFTIRMDGFEVGSVHKAWLAFTDRYELQIPDDTDPAFFVALVTAIDHCLHNENS